MYVSWLSLLSNYATESAGHQRYVFLLNLLCDLSKKGVLMEKGEQTVHIVILAESFL